MFNGQCKSVFQGSNNTLRNFFTIMLTRGLAYIMAIFVTLLAYKRAFSLSRDLSEGVKRTYNIDSRRLLLYPLAQLFIYTPTMFYSFISIWTSFTYYPLVVVTIFSSLGGFMNFVVYGGLLIHQKRESLKPRISIDHLNMSLQSNDRFSFQSRTNEDEAAHDRNRRESEIQISDL